MWYPCVGNSVHPNVPGWLIEAPSGRRVTVSNTAPITLRDGTVIGVNELDGHELPTCAGEMGWEGPCLARPAGLIEVARILVNQHTYAAGDDPDVGMVLTHNPKP